MFKKISVLAFVVFLFEPVITFVEFDYEDRQKICLNRGHAKRFFSELNCCSNQTVTNGLGTSAQWMKCAVPPTNDDEAYADTVMVVPKDQETISLIEFGKGMTTDYPETLKTKINEEIKNITSHDSSTNNDVDFKNIEMIDRLRVKYFDIEKQICGGDPFMISEGKKNTDRNCSLNEEIVHRGGYCCDDKSLPIYDIAFFYSEPKNCSNTLSKFKEKLETMNSTRVNTFMFECMASCQLIQNGVLSVEDLISFKKTDEIPIEKIMKELMPKYYSRKTWKSELNYTKTIFSVEDAIVEKDYNYRVKKTNGLVTALPEEIHGCAVHMYLLHRFALRHFNGECVVENL